MEHYTFVREDGHAFLYLPIVNPAHRLTELQLHYHTPQSGKVPVIVHATKEGESLARLHTYAWLFMLREKVTPFQTDEYGQAFELYFGSAQNPIAFVLCSQRLHLLGFPLQKRDELSGIIHEVSAQAIPQDAPSDIEDRIIKFLQEK